MMVKYELQKLCSPLRITIFVLLLIFRAILSYLPYSYDIAHPKAVYREYMNLLEGKTAAESAQWMESEKQWIEMALSAEVTEDMSPQEQFAITADLAEAQRKADAFQAVYEKYLYFCVAEQNGRQPTFFYDLDWNAYLDDDAPDWLFLVFIAAVMIPYFTDDRGKIYTMLYCTKYGRKKLIRTKLILCAAAAFLMAFLLNLIEGICFADHYSIEWANAPVYSLQAFSECELELPLAAYVLCKDLCNCFWSIAAAFLAAVTAIKSKTASFSALLLIIMLYIPYLFATLFSPALGNLCIGAGLSGHASFKSAASSFPLMLCCFSYTVHIAVLWKSTITSWCKSK